MATPAVAVSASRPGSGPGRLARPGRPGPPSRPLAPRPGRLRAPELALATLVVAVVGMMIVPLPTWLLDVLLATNLAVSVTVMLVVLYVPDALSIATFPTLLLVTTLFRLALNVSSSRLILLQADAGDVIRAFGLFVVRGNYVVGAVVFLVLTIIQFVVIAKGSERVAEVAARFVLDAMPGKQMAIDAELRAGSIDGGEARRRRHKLSRESQFYGAMDGAMKFVKGDVIASLVITLVNVLGGLAIGVGMKGLDVAAALKRYGLLTIGDGLVSQIPALVLSTAAGLLVTRVASEEPDTPLGDELAAQLFGVPRALKVAAVFVGLLGLVPGLPTVPFFVLAALLVAAAVGRDRALARAAEATEASPRRTSGGAGRPEATAFVPMVVPWALDASPALLELVQPPRGAGLRAELEAVRERLFADLGVPLPPPVVRSGEGLEGRRAVLSLYDVPARALVVPDHVPDAEVGAALAAEVLAALTPRAADFLGLAETQRLLDELEAMAPALVRNVVPKPVSLPLLADVLRRLVEEGVSVRDLRGVLEALSTFAPSEKDALQLAELVRAQLRRALTFRVTRGLGHAEVVLVDPLVEDTVRRGITRTAAGAFLTLPPAQARDLVASLVRAAGEARSARPGAPVVVLTQPDVRRFVRKLLETDAPDVLVTSFAELTPEVAVRPLARAHLGGIG